MLSQLQGMTSCTSTIVKEDRVQSVYSVPFVCVEMAAAVNIADDGYGREFDENRPDSEVRLITLCLSTDSLHHRPLWFVYRVFDAAVNTVHCC